MEELSSCFLKGAHTNWSVLAEDYNSIACTLSEGGVLDILHWRQERWILLRQLASHSQVNYVLVFLQLYVNSYLHLYLFMHTCTCVFTLELAIFLVRYM